MITMRDRANAVPDFEGEMRSGTRISVFVAQKAA